MAEVKSYPTEKRHSKGSVPYSVGADPIEELKKLNEEFDDVFRKEEKALYERMQKNNRRRWH